MNKYDTIIITDSACDLPEEYIAAHEISVLPLRLIYSYGEYKCGVDITAQQVIDRFAEEVPSTSQPSPGDIEDTLRTAKARGINKVLFILISSGLSGTFNMARLSCDGFEDMQIELYDTRTLSMALGYFVMEAVRLRDAGTELGQYSEALNKLRDSGDIVGFFYVATLDYLIKGGRIGLVQGTVGKLLNIRPIIGVNEEGKYYTITKTSAGRRALSKLADYACEVAGQREIEFTVLHGNNVEEAGKVCEHIKSNCNVRRAEMRELGPSLLVHTGPDMIAVCIRKI